MAVTSTAFLLVVNCSLLSLNCRDRVVGPSLSKPERGAVISRAVLDSDEMFLTKAASGSGAVGAGCRVSRVVPPI